MTTRRGARRTVALLGWMLAAAAMLQPAATQPRSSHAAGPAASPIDKATTMLFPVLRFGPNNQARVRQEARPASSTSTLSCHLWQADDDVAIAVPLCSFFLPQKRDLRHTLALAKHLGPGFGVVLSGFWRHYFDLGHKWGLNVEPGSGDLDPDGAAARSVQQARTAPADAPAAQHDHTTNKSDSTASGRHRPCFSSDFLPFAAVLSREPISKWLPATATVDELKQMHGWDGQLDALAYLASNTQDWLHLGHRDLDKALSASNVTVAGDAAHIPVPSFLNCNETLVKDLRKRLSKHRVVAVVFVLLGSLERPHMHLEEPTEPKEACPKAIWQANRLLQPAPWIDRLARDYIAKHLGGAGGRFLAVHLRPYPDTCLELWHAGVFDAARLHRKCHKELEDLHLRAAPCTLSLMRRSNATQLFVMVHPVLRTVTTSLLSKAGLEPHYLDLESLEELAGCTDTSATFAAMVEEQVAVHATAGFLGTSTSSISQSVAFARMGQGANDNVFFESAQNCVTAQHGRNPGRR